MFAGIDVPLHVCFVFGSRHCLLVKCACVVYVASGGLIEPRRIWSRTTLSIVFCPYPCFCEPANALSRFGPTVPLVFAADSVWQKPHFVTKSVCPLWESGWFAADATPP